MRRLVERIVGGAGLAFAAAWSAVCLAALACAGARAAPDIPACRPLYVVGETAWGPERISFQAAAVAFAAWRQV